VTASPSRTDLPRTDLPRPDLPRTDPDVDPAADRSRPAGADETEARPGRRGLAGRIGRAVRAAHSASVPF
jgi:hypothetical protein